jgi:hypothetical protein
VDVALHDALLPLAAKARHFAAYSLLLAAWYLLPATYSLLPPTTYYLITYCLIT